MVPSVMCACFMMSYAPIAYSAQRNLGSLWEHIWCAVSIHEAQPTVTQDIEFIQKKVCSEYRTENSESYFGFENGVRVL